MVSLANYIKECIFESQMIFEKNEKVYPKPGSHDTKTKFEIWVGDHAKQRQEERNVSTKEIIDAFYAAWPELNKGFKEGKFDVYERGKQAKEIVIIDARKDRQTPLTIGAFCYRNRATNKLLFPAFTIKTVYRDTGGAKQNREDRFKIFLY